MGFLGLVSSSVYATSLALESQAVNISSIDIATHQRTEVNNIARAVIGMQTEIRQNVYYLNLLELDQAVGNMGNMLEALMDGGTVTFRSRENVVKIPPTNDTQAREILSNIQTRWSAIKAASNILVSGGDGIEKSRAITEIETQIPVVVTQIDKLTSLLQISAARNLSALRAIQVTLFLGAIVLLTWGYFLVRNNILMPLSRLNSASKKIASGNLDEAVTLEQRDEVGALADSFETMRQELAAAREASENWAEQLEARVDQRTKELAALLDISADLSSRLEVESVLSSVVDTAHELLHGKVSVI